MLKNKPVYEKHIRSIVKSITFRIAVILSDSLISLFITKNVIESISVVFFTNVSSTILYYLHERLWNKISWHKTYSEHFLRSIVKSVSFRIVVVISDLIITSLIIGSFSSAFGIILFTNISSTVLYYIHERVWNIINFGTVTK